MSDSRRPFAGELGAFAAAVAHDIRTPLSAVAGEVEIALRRERTPAEYREALGRIASSVAELVEISADLTLLSAPRDELASPSVSAALGAVLRQLRARYRGRADVNIATDGTACVQVAGGEPYVARALTLIVEHAIHHRKGDAQVSLRMMALSNDRVRLAVDAQPPGFWPRAWTSLSESPADAAAPLRIRTAQRILDASGGGVFVATSSELDAVHIELPLAL